MAETLTIRESMERSRPNTGWKKAKETRRLQAVRQAEQQVLAHARCGLRGCRFQRRNITLARWIPLRDEHRATEHPEYRVPKWRKVAFRKAA